MGVYIPSVRLPDKGYFPEHFVIDSDGFVYKTYEEALFSENAVGKAIEVPPHGDLIDRMALLESIKEARKKQPEIEDVYTEDYFTVAEWLMSAPTIIEAEEETE